MPAPSRSSRVKRPIFTGSTFFWNSAARTCALRMLEDTVDTETSGNVGNDGSFEGISISILSVGEDSMCAVTEDRSERANQLPCSVGSRKTDRAIRKFRHE